MLCPIYYKLRNVENLFEPTRFYNFFFFFFFLEIFLKFIKIKLVLQDYRVQLN